VLMGSGINAQGMKMLLMAIKKYFPSPAQRPIYGNDTSNGEMVMLQYDCTKHTSAKVFKTLVDPFIGKYSMIKVVTGVLKAGDMIYNVNKEREDKAAKLYILRGKEAIEVSELHAGDIGALTKIEQLATGDTLASKGATVLYQAPDISTPYTYMRYKAKNKGDEDKIATALGKLMDEDLTLKTVNDS